MSKSKVIEVECQCGARLAKYEKVGRGVLIKMWLDHIIEDDQKIFLTEPHLSLGDDILCRNCENRVATLRMINGRPAAKMNQGGIKRILT